MNHFSRKPVTQIETNDDLLDMQKAIAADQQRSTDFSGATEDVYPGHMEAQYRTPHDRVNGNEMFRRYPDGKLDFDYAKHKVVEAIHAVRDGVALTPMDETALSCLFPAIFSSVDAGMSASMRAVNLKISPEEHARIVESVSLHLGAEMQFLLSCHAR